MIIHPKDPIPKEDTCGVVYEVGCKNCKKTYVGETGRKLCTRIAEHQKDFVTSSTPGVNTRATRTRSATEVHKSAITDHMIQNNHLPDWNNTKVLARETNNTIRRIREAIWIRKKDNMNRDEGAYQLSHIYDNILIQKQPSTRGGGPRKTSTFTLTQHQQQQQSVNNSKTSTQVILM